MSRVLLYEHSQETDVDSGNGTMHWEFDNTARLGFQLAGIADVVGGLLDLEDVCRALTVGASIIAVRSAMHIHARYRLISGCRNIVPKPSFTATKNPRIWIQANCEKVRGFGGKLGTCNDTTWQHVLSFCLKAKVWWTDGQTELRSPR